MILGKCYCYVIIADSWHEDDPRSGRLALEDGLSCKGGTVQNIGMLHEYGLNDRTLDNLFIQSVKKERIILPALKWILNLEAFLKAMKVCSKFIDSIL